MTLIEDKLADLPKSGGAWRDGLAEFLGEELYTRLHIVTTPQPNGPHADTTDQIRAKVIWHLRRLIQNVLNNEDVRQSARFRFNITTYSELRAIASPEKRAIWGNQRGLCKTKRTTSEHMTKKVVPELSRELSRQQPVPPPAEIDAIIAEFYADGLDEVQALALQTTDGLSVNKAWHAIKSADVRNIITGAVAALVSAAIIAVVAVTYNAVHTQSTSPPGLTDSPLLVTLTGFSSACHAVVFPRSLAAAASPFINQTQDKPKFMADTLKIGAYASSDLAIHIDLQTALPQQVTVYNIRIVDLQTAEPVEGSIVSLKTCQGESTSQMILPINEPDQGPFAVDEGAHRTNTRYFDANVIQVAPGKKQTVVIGIDITDSMDPLRARFQGSYVFKIALDVEIDGRKSMALVDYAGSPFRLTGSPPCGYDTFNGEPAYKVIRPYTC